MKKVVSIALALVMVLSMVSMAFAADMSWQASGVAGNPELKAKLEKLKSNASGWSPKSNVTIGNFRVPFRK